MGLFEKPPLHEIHDFLRRHRALIVHFSGTPPSGNTDIRYPDDLRRVIEGSAAVMTGIACSVVKPGDVFIGTEGRNAYGTIGIIVDLFDEQSLATATRGDGGSLWYGEGPREFEEQDLSVADLERSIEGRDGNNEWGVRNFIVRGLFVINPVEICQLVDHGEGPTNAILPYSIAQVANDFRGMRIYSFADNQIVELHPRGHLPVVDHPELYR